MNYSIEVPPQDTNKLDLISALNFYELEIEFAAKYNLSTLSSAEDEYAKIFKKIVEINRKKLDL